MDDDVEIEKKIEPASKGRESPLWKNPLWKSPLVISVVAATLALFGNIITNILNNRATAEAEHFRAQSNLVLSVIKTNGNTDDACKNLNFFVDIGWLDDPKETIHKACGTKSGIPTLPATAVISSEQQGSVIAANGLWAASSFTVRVEDADSHQPIANAKVDLRIPKAIVSSPQSNALSGGENVVTSTTTDSEGNATFNFVSVLNSVAVSKDGYESVTKPLFPVSVLNPTIAIIDLHRVSKK